MDSAPKLVVSSLAQETIEESPRTRRSPSNQGEARTRSSSTASNDIQLASQNKRKPSTSNPFFQTPRKLSTSLYSKGNYNGDTVESSQGQKGRELGKQQQLQPTYRTQPQENKRFTPHVVKTIMDNALEEALETMDSYEASRCRALSVSVCEDIKQKIKWLNYERYKLVCVVYFGSVNGQEMRVASRCLWNESWDNFASSSVRKGDVYAVALMYGVYTD